MPALPQGSIDEPAHFIELNQHYDDLEPVQGAPYKLLLAHGGVITGKLDANGFARHEGIAPGSAKVQWGEDERSWQAQEQRTNAHVGAACDAQSAIDFVKGLRA